MVSLSCSQLWTPSTHKFNVNLTWTIVGAEISWISRFRLEWKKQKQGIIYFPHIVTPDFYPKVLPHIVMLLSALLLMYYNNNYVLL